MVGVSLEGWIVSKILFAVRYIGLFAFLFGVVSLRSVFRIVFFRHKVLLPRRREAQLRNHNILMLNLIRQTTKRLRPLFLGELGILEVFEASWLFS